MKNVSSPMRLTLQYRDSAKYVCSKTIIHLESPNHCLKFDGSLNDILVLKMLCNFLKDIKYLSQL